MYLLFLNLKSHLQITVFYNTGLEDQKYLLNVNFKSIFKQNKDGDTLQAHILTLKIKT